MPRYIGAAERSGGPSTYLECAFSGCNRPLITEFDFPLCSKHCRTVYLTVRDMLANATPEAVVHYPNGRAKPLASKRIGTVYFARIGEHIKIGYTTNLKERMSHLHAELLATMPGTMGTERALHAKFGALWVRGELFRPGQGLLDYIADLNTPPMG